MPTSFQPQVRTPFHLRPVDRRQYRPRSLRRADPQAAVAGGDRPSAGRGRRVRRQLPRQRPGAHRRHARRARPHRQGFQAGSGGHRAGRTDGHHQPVQPIRPSRTAPSPATTPQVRAYALQKTMHAIDLGVELGAKIYVFWGGREGVETDAAKDPLAAIKRNREAMNFLCEYALDQGYDLQVCAGAKPNEPRGDIYNATIGHMLAFIETLDHPGDGGRQSRRWRTSTWPASTFCTAWRRPGTRASCSTSTSTTRPLAATTRTSASARST